MRILIDSGHPAHVHLFRNMAIELSASGHEVFFTVREGENQAFHLEKNQLRYKVIGRKKKTALGKLSGIIFFTFRILLVAARFRPDIFVSHGSMYAGYAAFFCRKKHIALEDTGNMEQLVFSLPVSDVILSPQSLKIDLGKKHLRYKGFHELAYLHPRRFSPDASVLGELGVKSGESYVILRFISWNATHDFRQQGLSHEQKKELIEMIRPLARVFISSEKQLPPEFEQYLMPAAPHRLHDALSFASLYIGEGSTTASECAMLGTPSIYISSLRPDILIRQQSYGLLSCYSDTTGLAAEVLSILKSPDIRDEYRKRREKMLSEHIDVTAMLVWFVENYPASREQMMNDPDFQLRFK